MTLHSQVPTNHIPQNPTQLPNLTTLSPPMEAEKSEPSAAHGVDSPEDSTIEKTFSSDEVPPWRSQLTLRAFIISFFLSVLFTFIVMKLNLTTGIIPSLNVSAGLLGFFFVKTWTKFLDRFGVLKQPFTRQENTVIQTCVVAAAGIAFSGGFGSYIYGMSEKIADQGDKAFAMDVKNPALGWMIGFLFTVSFLGLFSVVPLRKKLSMWLCLKLVRRWFDYLIFWRR